MCSLFSLWSFICSKSRFRTSLSIMHCTHVVINFRDVDAFNIIIFSSLFSLDMDCIIRYHWCFSSWFATPLLISSYSICFLCQSLTCLVHPFSLICHRSIQHNNLTCSFALSFLLFVFFYQKVLRKAIKRFVPVCMDTW
jgi:hypothetical protein